MIVVDASAMVEVLLQTDLGARVEGRLFRDEDELHCPHLLDLEVLQAMRRFLHLADVDMERAREAVEDLHLLAVHRHGHDYLLRRIWELRGNLSAYDAAYVALAEALPAVLITCDRRLAAAPGHSAKVEVLYAEALAGLPRAASVTSMFEGWKKSHVAVADYLKAEACAETRHEYVAGSVYAMVGASNAHNLIAGNIHVAFANRLRGRACRPFNSDTRIRLRLQTHPLFYYPDVSVQGVIPLPEIGCELPLADVYEGVELAGA